MGVPLRIMASPAFGNEAGNPYNAALSRALAVLGVDVAEYSTKKLLSRKYQIWHVHWPDLLINGPTARVRLKRTFLFIVKLLLARLHGVKVIWTVHNIRPHDYRLRLLQRAAYWLLLRCISGFISLSQYAEQAAVKAYPRLRRISGFVVPHGHYQGLYKDEITQAEARLRLHIAPHANVYLFFGMIRPYKNLERLIEVFGEIRTPDAVLIIAGYSSDSQYVELIRTLSKADARIRYVVSASPIPSAEVQYFMRAADVVVLPYREILNSGAALLALSFHIPVVVPRMGSSLELEQLFGNSWVRTYDTLRPEQLVEWQAAAKRLASADHEQARVALATLDWTRIASLTVEAYKAVLRGSNAPIPHAD